MTLPLSLRKFKHKKLLLMTALRNRNSSPAKKHQHDNQNKKHLSMYKFYCLFKTGKFWFITCFTCGSFESTNQFNVFLYWTLFCLLQLPSETQKASWWGIFPDEDGARTSIECCSSPLEEKQQACQEALAARQLEEEAQPDLNQLLSSACYNCPSESEKQAAEGSCPRKTELERPLNVAARPSLWKHDAPSFYLGISPLTSQPTPPTSQPTVSQLEILAEAVVDAGVTTALKFSEATSAEPSFIAAEVYKTSEKEKEVTEEPKEKCYH
ncbi:uncharacterized protein LOC127740699 [Arachis duranensis]|uniref:Uncharacterized protein LOC127740699 n=1 Tax=Arachis duranensis TaxID=130453 RepID=A0A9C6T6E9_ARADU|nr:uncharacterized protein LOC127740699 [Arachis duranensis]XP_052108201.1 uncharacterized protein LOC127740699 [Arachis duranensis]XP_052108202.1 uncharacterized protein LOC127740699 [Arachis duranensis]XP_052108203.1 uncharacterized protein LOC127740699 [Arachis duranensis]XP_052108204.1 uncharacterized protein LOC127740699 [Arachis duranensis]